MRVLFEFYFFKEKREKSRHLDLIGMWLGDDQRANIIKTRA